MDKIYIVGNPNCGKTTLFNKLTQSFEHTGNYSGVTVDYKEKEIIKNGNTIRIVDLPGTYSISHFTLEEKVTSISLLSEIAKKESTATIINLCEDKSIKRGLGLTIELLEAGFKVLMIVNEKGNVRRTNTTQLAQNLGINILHINIRKVKDLSFLTQEKLYKQNLNLPYIKKYKNCSSHSNAIVPIKILEQDNYALRFLKIDDDEQKIVKNAFKNSNLSIKSLNFDRLQYINQIDTIKKSSKIAKFLDYIFLNKYFAIPSFLLIMLLIFYITFSSVGAFLSGLLKSFFEVIVFSGIESLLTNLNTNAIFNDFILTSVIEGTCSLICFLPQIILLFMFLTFLEDSGYLPRLAFLLDDLLAKFGLSGKSIFSFVMSFGCSTTAMLTAKNLDNEKTKIKTMLLTPYMTCSAKLPVLTVLCSAFFTNNILLIFAFYLIAILVAVVASIFFQSTKLKTNENTFILEIPDYNFPELTKVVKVAVSQGTQFLFRIGGIVLIFMAIIWLLENFNFKLQFVDNSKDSILFTLGSIIAPLFAPLGFDNFGICSALIVGVVAKEVIVSTFSMLNHTLDGGVGLVQSLALPSSVVCFTTESALSFMVFVLLYSPCISSMSVIKKELGKKYLLQSMIMQFVFAYLASFTIYTLALAISNGVIVIALTILLLFVTSIFCLSRSDCAKTANCFSCQNCVYMARCKDGKNKTCF